MKHLLPLFLILASPILADTPDCEAMAAQTGAEFGLPAYLLPAISRMETGYSHDGGPRRAWPWTLNEGGRSHYFDTQEEALAYLENAVSNGVTNIDVGCMQINYRWHHDNFDSLADMMDPVQNILYGAEFLSELYRRTDDWGAATGDYHSLDNRRGRNYQIAVAAILTDIASASTADSPTPAGDTQPAGFLLARVSPLIDMQTTVSAYVADDLWRTELSTEALEGFEAVEISLLGPNDVSGRIRRDWDKVEAFRELLAQ